MKPNHLNSLWLAACVLASSLLVAQCDNNSVALTFNAGTFLDEVSFNVTDADGNILLESMPGSEASDTYVYNLCLDDGCYTINMYDSFGDGWNGGSLVGEVNGAEVLNTTLIDGEYGTDVLSVNGGDDCVSVSPTPGCTDEAACNYDADATYNDYSCTYPGCMDEAALNYNWNAGCDDGSCEYAPDCDGTNVVIHSQSNLEGNSGSYSLVDVNGNELAAGNLDMDNELAIICLEDGCYGLVVTPDDPDAWLWWTLTTAEDPSGWGVGVNSLQELTPFVVADGTITADNCDFGFGCTDAEACNYDADAEYNDGSCTYPGCSDPAAINFDWSAGCEDDSCEYCSETGIASTFYVCTFSNGNEVELELVNGAGEVILSVSDLGDMAIESFAVCLEEGECYTVNMSNNTTTGWYGGYWSAEALGYNVGAGSLSEDSAAESVTFSLDNSCPNPGCTDSGALNYNPEANEDDGSCEYPEPCDDTTVFIHLYDSFGDGWNGGSLTLSDDAGNEVGTYSMETGDAALYTECLGDGCYVLTGTAGAFAMESTYELTVDGVVIAAGTLPAAETFTVGDGECSVVFGCTDADACNYDADATNDNDTCTYPGCLDPNAINFDWNAGCEGECEYCAEGGVVASVYICTFANGGEVEMEILDDEGNVVFSSPDLGDVAIYSEDVCLLEGVCYTVVMSNNTATGWYGGYYWVTTPSGYQASTGALGDDETSATLTFSLDNSCPEAGCTDADALNYNPNATEDDGSCIYPEPCDDTNVIVNMYDSFGDGWNGGSYTITDADGNLVAEGDLDSAGETGSGDGIVTDGLSFGYDVLCLGDGCYTMSVVGDIFADEISWDVMVAGVEVISGGADESAEFGINTEGCGPVLGCTDPIALNYDADAEVNDGSCEYGPGSWTPDPMSALGVDQTAPNPFSEFVDVEIRDAAVNQISHVYIHDLAGRLVLETTFEAYGRYTQLHLNTTDLESGQYVLTVTSGGQAATKLVSKR